MKKRIFSILLSIGMMLTLLPGTVLADDTSPGYKDIYPFDNTVDNSVSIVTGVVHLTGEGGTQAGYYEGKTVYEGQENVTYSNPKTAAVQGRINDAYNIVDKLSKGVKERGKRGEYHMSTSTSKARVWDNREYPILSWTVTAGPEGVFSPGIEVEPVEGKKDTYKDSTGKEYSTDRYQITRTHDATGDYGKETFYRVEANGWVAGYDITTATNPAEGGTATSDLTASLSGETVNFTATPAAGYEFDHWEVVDSSGTKRIWQPKTSYTMPASDVTATAVFTPAPVDLATGRSDGGTLKVETTQYTYEDARATNMNVERGSQVVMTATPAEGYEFAGYYEGIFERDPDKEGYGFVTDYDPEKPISNDKNYTYTATEGLAIYALFRKEEVLSDNLRFNFVNYGHAPASLTDLVTSVTVNGEDWPLPDTGMNLTNPVPVGSKVTAVVRVADNAIFLYAWSEYLSDLEYQYSDDYSTCTLTFTTPPWAWSPTGIIPEVHCLVDKAVDIHYDANGGTRGPGWYGGQGDVEKLSAFVAENWTEWDVNDLLVTPDDAGEIVVYPPEGATSAGVEITDKKGVHTGAPGETITGLDLSEGATIKYLWTRDIDKVEITLDAPVCGTEITTPEDVWSQTNPPSVSVPDGAGYKLNNMYGGAPAIWVNSDPNYEPFEGTMKGGETYLAQIMLVPDSGAAFSENVEIVVNGGTPVNKDLSESVLAVFASVTAEHTPGSPVKENETLPTCTTGGKYDVVVYCTACGEEISRNAVDIPALGHDWGEWIVDKEATEEEDGRHHRECSRCDAVEVEKIPMIVATYGVAEGDGATWYTGSNDSLTFTFKRSVNDEKTFDLFQRIEIDGKEVAPANYEAKAGSVIITLKPEYIKTLAVGKHTLTAFFENGKTADASFTIAEKKADVVPGGDTAKKGTGVKTGDNANTVLYMGLGIAALLIIAVTLILLKRRERQEQ